MNQPEKWTMDKVLLNAGIVVKILNQSEDRERELLATASRRETELLY